MASFFSITAEMVGGVILWRGGLLGGVKDFLDPRLTGGRGGVFCTCFLGFLLEGGSGGGRFPFAPPGEGGRAEPTELR